MSARWTITVGPRQSKQLRWTTPSYPIKVQGITCQGEGLDEIELIRFLAGSLTVIEFKGAGVQFDTRHGIRLPMDMTTPNEVWTLDFYNSGSKTRTITVEIC